MWYEDQAYGTHWEETTKVGDEDQIKEDFGKNVVPDLSEAMITKCYFADKPDHL